MVGAKIQTEITDGLRIEMKEIQRTEVKHSGELPKPWQNNGDNRDDDVQRNLGFPAVYLRSLYNHLPDKQTENILVGFNLLADHDGKTGS